MTREEALCKLLRHGPLSVREAATICCWPAGEAESTMKQIHSADLVKRVRSQNGNITVFTLTKRGLSATEAA